MFLFNFSPRLTNWFCWMGVSKSMGVPNLALLKPYSISWLWHSKKKTESGKRAWNHLLILKPPFKWIYDDWTTFSPRFPGDEPPSLGKEENVNRRGTKAAKAKPKQGRRPKSEKALSNSGPRRIVTEYYHSQVLIEDFVDTSHSIQFMNQFCNVLVIQQSGLNLSYPINLICWGVLFI